jgi:hypothetical protein
MYRVIELASLGSPPNVIRRRRWEHTQSAGDQAQTRRERARTAGTPRVLQRLSTERRA